MKNTNLLTFEFKKLLGHRYLIIFIVSCLIINGVICYLNADRTPETTYVQQMLSEYEEDAEPFLEAWREIKQIESDYDKLYATDPEETVTYVSDEEAPGEFKKIWDRRIAFIFTDGNELFFKSKDPDNMDSDTYYFYRTDFEGNVKSKHELNGGMYWGGLHDGRNLYYVPQEKISIVLPDGSEQETHPRYMYKLDIETGEQTVAFEFSGDYSLMYLGQSGNDLMVYDNKIYTYDLCGYVPKDDGEGYDMLNLKRGLVIIDMDNGDITYITAELDRTDPRHPTITNVEIIPMDP